MPPFLTLIGTVVLFVILFVSALTNGERVVDWIERRINDMTWPSPQGWKYIWWHTQAAAWGVAFLIVLDFFVGE